MTPSKRDALIEAIAITATVALFGLLTGILGAAIINYEPK